MITTISELKDVIEELETDAQPILPQSELEIFYFFDTNETSELPYIGLSQPRLDYRDDIDIDVISGNATDDLLQSGKQLSPDIDSLIVGILDGIDHGRLFRNMLPAIKDYMNFSAPIYRRLLDKIDVYQDDSVGTLGVGWHKQLQQYSMVYNPEFITRSILKDYLVNENYKSLEAAYIYVSAFFLCHEVGHVLRTHVIDKDTDLEGINHQVVNIAGDVFINMSLVDLLFHKDYLEDKTYPSVGLFSWMDFRGTIPAKWRGESSQKAVQALADELSSATGRSVNTYGRPSENLYLGEGEEEPEAIIKFKFPPKGIMELFNDNSAIFIKFVNDTATELIESPQEVLWTGDKPPFEKGDRVIIQETGEKAVVVAARPEEDEYDIVPVSEFPEEIRDIVSGDVDASEVGDVLRRAEDKVPESLMEFDIGDVLQGRGSEVDKRTVSADEIIRDSDDIDWDEVDVDWDEVDWDDIDPDDIDPDDIVKIDPDDLPPGVNPEDLPQLTDEELEDMGIDPDDVPDATPEPGEPEPGEPEPGEPEPGEPGEGEPDEPGEGEPDEPGEGEPDEPGEGEPGGPGSVDDAANRIRETTDRDNVEKKREEAGREEGFDEDTADESDAKDRVKRDLEDAVKNVDSGSADLDALRQMGANKIASLGGDTASEWRRKLNRILEKALGIEVVYDPNRPSARIEGQLGREVDTPAIRNLVFSIDCSASMGPDKFTEVLEHIDTAIRAKRLKSCTFHVVYWGGDADQLQHDRYRRGGQGLLDRVHANAPRYGGTDPNYQFKYIAEKIRKPDGIIIFTDGEFWGGPDDEIRNFIGRYRKRLIWVVTQDGQLSYILNEYDRSARPRIIQAGFKR